jgi:membrane carboxypeptidase/penicillin-binding protein
LLAPDSGDYQPADRITLPVGPLNLREALRVSSNRAAVALGNRVGIPRVIEEARALGITTPIPDYPSTVLGAAEVVPIELVAAYAAFSNGGMRVTPRFMTSVESRDGKVLWVPAVEMSTAMQPGVAYLMTSVLEDVVNRGTGAAARAEGPSSVPLAGKTGTTNDAQDVWFVGATPEMVAGVWMGFDKPRPLGNLAAGGRLAAPLWGRVMAAWQRGKPVPPAWAPPAGLEEHEIDTRTGGLATAGCPREQVAREWFLPGTAPPSDCPEHAGGVAGFLQRTFGALGRIFH